MSIEASSGGEFGEPFVVGEPISMSPHETTFDPLTDVPGLSVGSLGTICESTAGGSREAGCISRVLDDLGHVAIAICLTCDFREEVRLDSSGRLVRAAARFQSRW